MSLPEGASGFVAGSQRDVRGRPAPGFSVVAMACGTKRILRSAVRDIVSRACQRMRCVVISKTSGSGARAVVGGCHRQVRGIIDRPSGNLCSTVGGKVSLTANSCLYFLGTNSDFRRSSALRRVMRSVDKGRLPSMLCNRATVMSGGKRFLHVHHLSTPGMLA